MVRIGRGHYLIYLNFSTEVVLDRDVLHGEAEGVHDVHYYCPLDFRLLFDG